MLISSPTRTKAAVVLIVDPDPARQRETRDRLVILGYTVRSADDYEAALGIVEATPPDVVVVTGLPDYGDGWNNLQTEVNRWGLPVVTVEPTEGIVTDSDDRDLKLRIDAAAQARTLQDALMTENARLSAERLHDPLTGLFNRRYIMIRVEEEILRSSRRGHPLSCMLIDVDDLSSVNENWGHQTGDIVLRDMAHLITRTMRASDVACRYRDDQFLVLLTDTDAGGAQIAANRLRDTIASYNFFNQTSSEPIKLTASVGVAYWQPITKPGQEGTWEPQIIGLSERALKASKQSGKNRLVILQAT
jgi:diguanylate cyclase (GGDEF)-like protein